MKTKIPAKTLQTKKVKKAVEDMPYFTVGNLAVLGVEKYYLKILLSRLKQKGELVSLKRGFYVSYRYLDKITKKGKMNDYSEFLFQKLYSPSYLSLEYVLNEYNLLSESSFGFSGVSTKKTASFSNDLGRFYYHTIKKELFKGFEVLEKDGFFIYKATPAKAMFDFLYLRKDMIADKSYFSELRLNLDNFRNSDIREFKKYVKEEGSAKMKTVSVFLEEEKEKV
jgi:predicted transcriptional regulator of viral defense system